jgi:Uncharacterised ACR, YagE family COG1723
MIFWENEPTLNPLYSAVREYLEIKPRIQVLNERLRVFLDLAEILSDAIADKKMTRKLVCWPRCSFLLSFHVTDITWIIIVLIIISIFVTCSEVFLRFGLLTSSKNKPLYANTTNMVVGVEAFAPVNSLSLPISITRHVARAGLVTASILYFKFRKS